MTGSAVPQLLDLAEAVRGPVWRDQLAPAMAAARRQGWSFEQVLLFTVRLLVRDGAMPQELLDAARDPVRWERPGPEVAVRGAARAREALEDAGAGT